eukprot:CAMPEP_0113566640 /NCGR_PEP_ID=MMETSP0015_2-20120614/22833_1 /TAXON_ID=2838 /ORGANISM="Odontella" /LENGTH=254 /DNA_ID=CAMNT_0000468947 /DNA_START=162 /DNA_END=926 /DNA_ORIENTATION=+ /assembly_acc=CAM_ASM_000160
MASDRFSTMIWRASATATLLSFFALLFIADPANAFSPEGISTKVDCDIGSIRSNRLTFGCRREFFTTAATAATGLGTVCLPQRARARSPGSMDVVEAVKQIRDASEDLRNLQHNWDRYAVIDKEGRAVTDATVLARRILGGVAPLAGATAIEVAKATPLYRIDGAFNAVRKVALSDDDGAWAENLDLLAFEELSERLQFELQKADGDLYSVQFASKGTTQISGIYKEAKAQIDQGLVDIEEMKVLLRDAGAPGL